MCVLRSLLYWLVWLANHTKEFILNLTKTNAECSLNLYLPFSLSHLQTLSSFAHMVNKALILLQVHSHLREILSCFISSDKFEVINKIAFDEYFAHYGF